LSFFCGTGYVASLAAFDVDFRAGDFGFLLLFTGFAAFAAVLPFAATAAFGLDDFALPRAFVFAPAPFSMRAAMRRTASSIVTASGGVSLGIVAFTLPNFTYGP
jgi:hypothetical protein